MTGFTVMYAIHRPSTWWISAAADTGTFISAAKWQMHGFWHKRSVSANSANEPSGNQYSGHPMKEDFNFNITVKNFKCCFVLIV